MVYTGNWRKWPDGHYAQLPSKDRLVIKQGNKVVMMDPATLKVFWCNNSTKSFLCNYEKL